MIPGNGEKKIKNEVFLLAMDTTSKESSICLSFDNKIIAEYNFLSTNDLSENIISIIDFLLKRGGVNLDDIDIFGIGIGPGIFTGIRVGLSTIKGLTFNRSVKIVPVNILNAISLKSEKTNDFIIPIIDAKREQVYFAGYKIDSGKIKEYLPPALVDISELKSILETDLHYEFMGTGSMVYHKYLKQNFSCSINEYRSNFVAAEIGKIAYRAFIDGRGESDIEKINPLYIRKTDAEENYERNNKKGKVI